MQPGDTVHPETTTEKPSTPVPPAQDTMPEQNIVKEEFAGESMNDSLPQSRPIDSPGSITWRASEYVDHEKSLSWYVVLAAITLLVTGAVFMFTDDIFSAVVVAISAILFGVVAARKPQTLDYVVDHGGIRIGEKLYQYGQFKTFSVVDDGAIHSIVLLPLKRFMPPLSLYYPPEEENGVVETLGLYIPYHDGGADGFDRLMSRIRF